MLFEAKERLEGLTYNIDFGERGWEYTGKGIRMSTTQKRPSYKRFSTLLSLIVVFPTTKLTRNTVINKTTMTGHLLEQWHPIHLQSRQALMILGCQSGQQNSLQPS